MFKIYGELIFIAFLSKTKILYHKEWGCDITEYVLTEKIKKGLKNSSDTCLPKKIGFAKL